MLAELAPFYDSSCTTEEPGKSFYIENEKWLPLANLRDRFGSTLLHYAAEAGQEDLARTLLNQGYDPNVEDNSGQDAFCYAASNGHPNVMAVISQCNSYRKPCNKTISDLLCNAAFKANGDVIKFLVGVYCHKSFLRFDVARMLCDATSAGDYNSVRYISNFVADPKKHATNKTDLPEFLPRNTHIHAFLTSKNMDKRELFHFAVDRGL